MSQHQRYEARYRMTEIKRWDDPAFKALSDRPSAQLLLCFIEQGPYSLPIPGVSSVGKSALAERKGWTLRTFNRVFSELEATGFSCADWNAPLLFLPRTLQTATAPTSPSNIKAWKRTYMELPPCPLRDRIGDVLSAFLQGYDTMETREATTPPTIAPTMPHASDHTYSGEGEGEGFSAPEPGKRKRGGWIDRYCAKHVPPQLLMVPGDSTSCKCCQTGTEPGKPPVKVQSGLWLKG